MYYQSQNSPHDHTYLIVLKTLLMNEHLVSLLTQSYDRTYIYQHSQHFTHSCTHFVTLKTLCMTMHVFSFSYFFYISSHSRSLLRLHMSENVILNLFQLDRTYSISSFSTDCIYYIILNSTFYCKNLIII